MYFCGSQFLEYKLLVFLLCLSLALFERIQSCYRHGAYECYYYQPCSESSRICQEERENAKAARNAVALRPAPNVTFRDVNFVCVYQCMYLISWIMHLGIASIICPLK
ncbi:hypothetical protein Bca4012_032399 [Brassica carinata]